MILRIREVYLDHNATTPLASEVRSAMDGVLAQEFGNPSSLHMKGRAARGLVEKAREQLARTLGCAPEQVFFTSGGTEANNTVLKGVFQHAARTRGASRCHVITSLIEHDSVLGACTQIEEAGGRVTRLPATRNGIVRPEELRAALTQDTILVSIMHANNETGVVQPVREFRAIAHEAGVPFHTDAVQSFGKIETRVDALGCDFLTLTAHKINGPKGAGALYWRGKHPWTPLIAGGDQERGLRSGTEGVHQIVGLGVACELAAARRESELQRLQALREEFLQLVRAYFPAVRVHEAPAGQQLPGTMNLAFPGHDAIRLLAGLDCYEVSVSVGAACTADRVEPSHVLLGMGLGAEEALSSLRFSMGTTTTSRDVRYAVEVLQRVLEHPPAGLHFMPPEHLTLERIRDARTFLVDLRLPHERLLNASIPGAKEWSAWNFDRNAKSIPKDVRVILVCGTGLISYAAGYRLASGGHKEVFVVQGGYEAWRGRFPELLTKLSHA